MTAPALPTAWLLELGTLFERAAQPLGDLEGQPLQGIPAWELGPRCALPEPVLAAWTHCVGYAGTYPVPWGEERVAVDLEAADDPAQFTYLCPETYRRRGLPARDAAVYTINTDKFLNSLAALFAIPEGLRQASPAPALDGQLWHLGKPRIGPTYFDVWFGRGLAKGVADIFQHFAAPAAPDQGLLLHAGLALPELIRPPRAYRTITLPEALVATAPLATLDQEHLYRLLTAPGAHRPQRTLPVHYDPHTQQLTLRSMPQPWLIKGRRQAAAVAHMFKQAEQERWWLKAEEILQAAYPPGTTVGRSARMQNLFRGNEEWELYIDNPKKGYYGFRVA